MNREVKMQVLFKVYDSCFNGDIHKHYTTVDRLCNGADTFDYKNVGVIAKRKFTGLKDKNGVEIYDGDVLSCYHFTGIGGVHHYHHHIVQWSDKFSGWFALNKESMCVDDGSVQLWVYMKSNKYTATVIGNIHQNP